MEDTVNPKPTSVESAYDTWYKDQTPENLNAVVTALGPIITSEIQRYAGPKPLLRAKAKTFAIRAVRTYSPEAGARLQSWVVSQLRPLSRYSKNLQPVHVSDDLYRQSSEMHQRALDYELENGRTPSDEELADYTGVSVKKIRKFRQARPAVSSESQYLEAGAASGSDVVSVRSHGSNIINHSIPTALIMTAAKTKEISKCPKCTVSELVQ